MITTTENLVIQLIASDGRVCAIISYAPGWKLGSSPATLTRRGEPEYLYSFIRRCVREGVPVVTNKLDTLPEAMASQEYLTELPLDL